MPETFHFISGLPRSGSTMLSAILRQNPRFHAGMSSPVASLFEGADQGRTEPRCRAGDQDPTAGVFIHDPTVPSRHGYDVWPGRR